ncbi:hypothetical protein [Nocardia xishanensis]|uniref:hypothetical protein n=1 Tax=Nocardia xishanensis TaxID=238964 RepID=UPI0008369F3F|nr:hypothetical protein [Nocardia xishanensis]
MADIYGLPDTTGRKEGDTWTTTLPDGRTVVNTIPQGNGNQTVDQVITNPDGSKTNSRVAGNGLGGWQRWNDDSTGTSSYAGKDTQDSDVYGQHFNPGESTSGRPSHEFGMSSDYKTTATASYDQQGNRVGTDVGHANTNGLYDNVHVDNYGNKTFSATTRDGNGGLVSTFTGQVDSDGYGWKILGDKRWDVSPDSQGKPVLTRTETTDKGVHLYRIDESGKTTHEFRGNKPGQWYRDTIGTDAEGKTTITRLDVHLGVTVYDTEGNILEGGPKVAPGTIDTLGIADKVIDTVFFWNPIAKGGNKAGVHALVGLGAMAGLWDDVSVPLNLPTQEQAFDGLVDTGKNLAKEYLYLGGTFKDTNGNPIYSPDGKLDQQHATLNFYNDLSKAVIGTDWSQFPDKPLETLGTAGFGIATFFIPGPKGLTGLANGERLAAGLGEAGARAAIPDQPWPSLPERIGGATDEGGVAAGGGTRSPGAVDRAMAAAREAMEALRRPWESPKEAWEGTGFGPGTPRRNQPMDSEGVLGPGGGHPSAGHGGNAPEGGTAPRGPRPPLLPEGALDPHPAPDAVSPSDLPRLPDGTMFDENGKIVWDGSLPDTETGVPLGMKLRDDGKLVWDGSIPGTRNGAMPPREKLPGGKQPTTTGDPKQTKPNPPLPEQRALERVTPPDRDGMVQNHPDWNVENIEKDSNVRGFVGDALTRAKLLLQGYRIIAAGEKAKIPVPGKPGEFFKPDFIAVDKNGNLVLVESKFNKSQYQPDQFDGYRYYAGNGKQLEIDLAENPDLLARLRRNRVDPSDMVVDRVETVRWDDQWAPTDEVLRRAADDPTILGDLVDGTVKNPEWRDSALSAFSELNAEAARRSFNLGDYPAAVHYQARYQALELIRNLRPSLQALEESLLGAGAPPGRSIGSPQGGNISASLDLRDAVTEGANGLSFLTNSLSAPSGVLRSIARGVERPVDQSMIVNIRTPPAAPDQITRAEELRAMTHAAHL